MEPPPPSPPGTCAGTVCCMCGDRGLPHELVRCKLCRVRLQHRYCSDLYPRATAYRRCNWCLREPAAQAHAHAHAHAVASKTAEKRKAVASTDTSASDEEEEGERQWHDAATRSAAVGKPVKKPKVDERPAPQPSPGAAAKGSNGDKKSMHAGKLALLPSPGAAAKGNIGDKKPMQVGKLALPPSPGAAAKGNIGDKKPMQAGKLALPPLPGAAAKGNIGDKKPMQAGKLARPGRVKVRRYKLLAEVISC